MRRVKKIANILTLAGFTTFLWLGPSSHQLAIAQANSDSKPSFASNPTLVDYLEWARQFSPRLEAGQARAQAVRADSRRVGALPSLKLSWGEMIVPVETRVGPQQRILSISQSIPWFGSLSAQENSYVAAANAADLSVRDQVLQIEKEVRAAWYDLTFIAGQRRLISENLILAQNTEVIARTRYESGEGSYQALLNAQMKVARHASHLSGLDDQSLAITTRLNVATGLAAYSMVPQTSDFPSEFLEAELPPRESLVLAMERLSPIIGEAQYKKQSRQQNLQAAGKQSYPDLTLGVDYIMTGEAISGDVQDSGKDPVIARLGLSLPLWGGGAQANKQASSGALRAAGAVVADTRLQLTSKLEHALYLWREAGRNRELYGKSLLPHSLQNLAVTTASYQSGTVPFADLQEVREVHLGLQLAHLRAETDRMLAINEIATLVGVTPEQLIHQNLDQLPSIIEVD